MGQSVTKHVIKMLIGEVRETSVDLNLLDEAKLPMAPVSDILLKRTRLCVCIPGLPY